MRMRGLSLFPACLLFAACATLPVLLPYPPPPEDLLKEVSTRLQSIQGLKGLAQVRVSSAEKSFSAQEVLFARRPGFLRIESVGPLGTPQLYVVTDGRDLSLYSPAENRYYRGQATGGHLLPALPIALEPEEAVGFLLGSLPLIDFELASIRADRKEGLWVLDLISKSRGEYQNLWVNPHSLQILRAEIHRPGLLRRLTFSDFRQVNNFLFPQRIQLTSFNPRVEVSVEYQEVELNPPWGAQDFQLPVPRGATVLPLK